KGGGNFGKKQPWVVVGKRAFCNVQGKLQAVRIANSIVGLNQREDMCNAIYRTRNLQRIIEIVLALRPLDRADLSMNFLKRRDFLGDVQGIAESRILPKPQGESYRILARQQCRHHLVQVEVSNEQA